MIIGSVDKTAETQEGKKGLYLNRLYGIIRTSDLK